MSNNSLSATDLAVHHHFNCDLYLHKAYHGRAAATGQMLDKNVVPSMLSAANFVRGNKWEEKLFSWLDDNNLLLTIPSRPVLKGSEILEHVINDDRDHFFLAGLNFWPPAEDLKRHFIEAGTAPVRFGLAKPDLIEITRSSGAVKWTIVDAKASTTVKTSHHVQIYFYTLCLSFLLPSPYFQSSGSAAIWLPPPDGFYSSPPSFDDLKLIKTSLLASSMEDFLFRKLPRILVLEERNVAWHFNPTCRGCPYTSECRERAVRTGQLGSMSNISLEDVKTLRDLLDMSRSSPDSPELLTDIEELSLLLSNPPKFDKIASSSPITIRKAKRVLHIPPKKSAYASPLVTAADTNVVQVTSRRNFTCPFQEDIAVIISLIKDPSLPTLNIASFCISVFSNPSFDLPEVVFGPGHVLITSLSSLIQKIISLPTPSPSTQFYMFSFAEHSLLQSHIINAALIASSDTEEIRLCIGALSQGAALLQTTFQPVVLSGALLEFLKQKSRSKSELQHCLERMGLSVEGTTAVLRKRIEDCLHQYQSGSTQNHGRAERREELGQLPRIVVLQKQIEQLVALPIPGFWDLPECAAILLPHNPLGACPSEEELFETYCSGKSTYDLLAQKNHYSFLILRNLRERVAHGKQLLVNQARVLSADFMDICQHESLRKLFFMQQFEVLAKLTDLWKSRIDGCPDAPILEYKSRTHAEYKFRLVSGTLESQVEDKERMLYNYLLVEDENSDFDQTPVEALFDDLGVSGLVFPLNKFTQSRWYDQHPRVQRELAIVGIRNMRTDGYQIQVTIQTWGNMKLHPGRRYRISPRLVDFNTTKVLSTLVELDFRWSSSDTVPFLQLVTDPKLFGQDKELADRGNKIQRLFTALKNLDVDSASPLVLKHSQNQAAQRILSNRLSVVWGPPGTGKTHTVALSLLRLLEVQYMTNPQGRRIIFITAMANAAIEACLKKLLHLIGCYRSIDALPTEWLEQISINRVLNGNDQAAPIDAPGSLIYIGTVFQLYNFSKKYPFTVDCVIIDEAGQLSLCAAALVLRSLVPTGKIIVAGDSEQLAPILTAQYPQLKTHALFGSVLDCLMFWTRKYESTVQDMQPSRFSSPSLSESELWSQDTVVQLTENFRLNPDLGEFVSTIYSRGFKPQKVQTRQLATALKSVSDDLGRDLGIIPCVLEPVQWFLLALSDGMLQQPQSVVMPPPIRPSIATPKSELDTIREISLALIRLQTFSSKRTVADGVAYEMHVKAEAAVAAAVAILLWRCSPQEDIFIATPHRIQRQAVRESLADAMQQIDENEIIKAMEDIDPDGESSDIIPNRTSGKITVDTVERLQGSEAAFVICLFSLPRPTKVELRFLLERRRLNVAISRAKTLCILIASPEVLRPSIHALADEEITRGYGFLKAYEERAWSSPVQVDVEQLELGDSR